MTADDSPAVAARKTAAAWRLVAAAIGGPRAIGGKFARLARTARLWLDPREVRSRLGELERKGFIDQQPGRWQILFGGLDMLRFVIEPASRDYYAQQGISFGFHQLLRVLDDPVSMIDPTGFLSERDTIIGHVMQVVHLNPIYDLQLLQMFPDGLDQLESQVAAMVAGTHPRRGTIGAIVEDPGYHARLLDYVRRYRRDPGTPPLVRQEQTLRDDPTFAAAERTFATLPGFIRYCNRLPAEFAALLRRVRRVRVFPVELAEPASP
ncbi:MAG: hypothetical protein H6Q91_2033 [Deltaproteobacteria bacterium]|nr:hypothetical protein [Deltaproteobacteria bacterium]